jgi:hypothetical protein
MNHIRVPWQRKYMATRLLNNQVKGNTSGLFGKLKKLAVNNITSGSKLIPEWNPDPRSEYETEV